MRPLAAVALALLLATTARAQQPLLTGPSAFTDTTQQHPGARHKITLAALSTRNSAPSVPTATHLIPRPLTAWPIAPAGFDVTLYAGGDAAPAQLPHHTKHAHATFILPRFILTAPNGDLFLSDAGAGTLFLLRGIAPSGKAALIQPFATGLDHPFGIAFYPSGPNPHWIYVATASTVVRFPYHSGDLHATARPQTILPTLPGGHNLKGSDRWTHDLVFTRDGKYLLVSVGSGPSLHNPDTHPREFRRATILQVTPDGKSVQVYASGLHNCVGEAINPTTGSLWCSTSALDRSTSALGRSASALGRSTSALDRPASALVPDYITSVPWGSFFGWPWYSIGGRQDTRLSLPCANGTGPNPGLTKPLTAAQADACSHVDLASKVHTPDVLLQPHMASFQMTFYPDPATAAKEPNAFPPQYDGYAFAAEHGSWRGTHGVGYEVITLPMVNGRSTGEYDDFLTGFVTPDGQVWGRPAGLTIANDGSLYVTDDGSRSVWHVTDVHQ
jgi:glucose/arabinose dehydrogenase